MRIEDNLKIIKLIDTYGSLLTNRQYEILTSYYFDNLSFSELGENYNISRQAISDSINQSIKALINYEEKLGIIANNNHLISKLQLIINNCSDKDLSQRLTHIIEDIRG